MARKGTELATAYYSLVPSLDGTAAAVNSQLGLITGPAAVAGQKGGAALGAGLLGGLKGVAIAAAALGVVGLLKDVGSFFDQSVQASSTLQESNNAVRVSYGLIADEIDRLSNGSAMRLGLSTAQFNAIAVQFSSFAETIAGEGGDVVDVIDQLTQRGADFASVYNIEVDSALGLFQSGLAGETEPLRRFGIDMSAAAVEAFALANGISDGVGALTEAEKVQARYGLLLAATSKVQGDFANTSDGLANSQRITNARFADAQAQIGEALLPAFEKFAGFLISDGVPLIEKLVEVFIKAEPAISAVADATLALVDFFTSNVSIVLEFFDAIEDGRITAQEAAKAIALLPAPIRSLLTGVRDFINGSIAGVANFLAAGFNGYVRILNNFIGLLRPVVATFNALFGTSVALPRINSIGTVSITGGSNASSPARVAGGGRRAFADGGVVTARPGGIPATIGEGRYDEAVIPLSPSVLSQLGEAIGGSGAIEIGVSENGFQQLLEVWRRESDGSRKLVIANGKKVFA